MNKSNTITLSFAVVIILIGAFVFMGGNYTTSFKKSDYAVKGQPVLIYTKEIKSGTNDYVSWQTVELWRKVGEADPEYLVTVGKAEESLYVYDNKISPDKRLLLINMGSKLKLLDLKNKHVTETYVPRQWVQTAVFSPDGKKLFIWDQKEKDYFVHLFDLESKQDTIIKEGKSEGIYKNAIWRKDGKIILGVVGLMPPLTGSRLNYFDLTDRELHWVKGVEIAEIFSSDGSIMARSKDEIDTQCQVYGGSYQSVYSVINPLTGSVIGKIGRSDQIVRPFAFSPDNKTAIYVGEKPLIKEEECNQESDSKFYVADIATGKEKELEEPFNLIKSWQSNFLGATEKFDQDKREWSIVIGDQALVKSDKELHIVAQYYY